MTQTTVLTIDAASDEDFHALMGRVEAVSAAVITVETGPISRSTPILAECNGNFELRIIVLWFNTSALEALQSLTGKQLTDGRVALDAAAAVAKS
ncbi:hypothetical protein NU688_33215 [Variovorax sp. ZS18.2.2]|uniref:hypothetical protein n=1 Tax=Variovorax sp. ZS18.2.2 TaxID=2971255 RepID=UPI002150DD2C|nr:hypothetical protein [Variovorax sp. ZS18.2.2]MCR6481059.1 hypothetical protein [Variovorax sp. ZS18.2.2]